MVNVCKLYKFFDGGLISLTTDGFITIVYNLEGKINDSGKYFLLNTFKALRAEISGDETALEVTNRSTLA